MKPRWRSSVASPERTTEVLASEVSSQIELHREHGGVVPELASRNHSLRLRGLVEKALADAGVTMPEIDAFAATTGPGLASSLLIGSTAAKGMACATDRPFLAINHLEGHLLSPFLDRTSVPPHLALIVSGGHTLLLDVEGPGRYRKLGGTRDDAAGEAYRQGRENARPALPRRPGNRKDRPRRQSQGLRFPALDAP